MVKYRIYKKSSGTVDLFFVKRYYKEANEWEGISNNPFYLYSSAERYIDEQLAFSAKETMVKEYPE